MGSIWLTRDHTDNLPLMDALFQARLTPLAEPLIEMSYTSTDLNPYFKPPQRRAVIATSRYGLRGLILNLPTLTRATPVFCVGQATGQTAKDLKFKQVICAEGNVESLLEKIIALENQAPQSYFYARGEDIAFPLAPTLQTHGIEVTEAVVYQALPRTQLTPPLEDKIKAGRIDRVVIYSKRTAQIFLQLMAEHGLMDCAPSLHVITISPQIAMCFENTPFKKVLCAQGPDVDHVMETILHKVQD